MLLMPKSTRVCIKTMPQPIEKHGLRANSVLSLDHWQCGCSDALPDFLKWSSAVWNVISESYGNSVFKTSPAVLNMRPPPSSLLTRPRIITWSIL